MSRHPIRIRRTSRALALVPVLALGAGAIVGTSQAAQSAPAISASGPVSGGRSTAAYPSADGSASPRATSRAAAGYLRANGPRLAAYARQLGPQAVVAIDPLTGTPANVARLDGFLTPASHRRPSVIVMRYLREHRAALGLDRTDLSTLRLRSSVRDLHGVVHLSWTQQAAGIPVAGHGLRAHVTRTGRLISIQGSPIHDLMSMVADAPPRHLSARKARRAALADVVANRDHADRSPMAKTPTARRVWALTARGLRPAWSTSIRPVSGGAYAHLVDAASGAIISRRNLVSSDRGDALVYPNYPGASKGGEQRSVNLFSNDWLARNATWLRGADAFAWADVNDDDELQPSEQTPVPGTARAAQFELVRFQRASSQCDQSHLCTWNPDTAYSWRANRAQTAVQAFYLASRFHDYLLRAPIGFTPQLGNFELNNGDPVLIQVLDGAATDGGLPDDAHADSSSMETPVDGFPPTMELQLTHRPGGGGISDAYLPSNTGESADVVFHEYAHGLVSRLVVDSQGNAMLDSLQSRALAEGWADYYALDYLVAKKLVDDPPTNGDVLFESYLTGGRAIARTEAIDCGVHAKAALCVKYSGAQGGYTYADLASATGGPDPHSDSMIWSQLLWDLRGELGHDLTAALITEALSLTPADPSFLDARDAVLEADRVLDDGDHRGDLWRLFANRGMGWSAASIDGDDTDVAPAYDVPPPASTPRATISGTVTNALTGEPVANALVFVAGHGSGLIGPGSDVTDANGRYAIPNLFIGTYPKLVVDSAGYDQSSSAVELRRGGTTVDVQLRRDWAASSGGGSIVDFTGPDFGTGCSPSDAIDQTSRNGWSTTTGDGDPTNTPIPKQITIELPQVIDVSLIEIDPSSTCGDAGSASMRGYRIEVSADGLDFRQVAAGEFGLADRGRLNDVPVDGGGATRFVRLWIDSPQVPTGTDCSTGPLSGCTFMDTSEIKVFGIPATPR